MPLTIERLQALLQRVKKPARYTGGEWNSIVKDWDCADVTLALAYPDVYEIGMSNLGLTILYDLVNRREGFIAERVFAPWDDMASAMRSAGVALFSLETRHALSAFDVVGFSLQYELTFSNVLGMLDLGGIPVVARDRETGDPLVIAGGSCALNPEPMAEFLDAFVVGEGEEVLLQLLERVRSWKAGDGHLSQHGRRDLLTQLDGIAGVYVPSLYPAALANEGKISRASSVGRSPNHRVKRRIVPALGPAPTKPIVPNMRVIHDRGVVEIQRGCSRGCRFCQAGIIYRPVRERASGQVVDAIDALMTSTGYDEVGLMSLSSSDHSGVEQIVAQAMDRHESDGLAISLPSLRIDSFSVRLAQMIQERRKTGFTFAPEAGSQRLRDVINKGVSEQDLFRTAEAAFGCGWNRIKLYFMIGLPTETDEDVLAIADVVRRMYALGKRLRGR